MNKRSSTENALFEKGPTKILQQHKRMRRLAKNLGIELVKVENKNPARFDTVGNGPFSSTKTLASMLKGASASQMEATGYPHAFRADAVSGKDILDDLATRVFYVCPGGLETIVDALRSRLKRTQILYDSRVTHIDHDNTVRYLNKAGERRRIAFGSKLVVTCPLPNFERIVSDHPDVQKLQLKAQQTIEAIPLVRIYAGTEKPVIPKQPYTVHMGSRRQRSLSLTPRWHQVVYASDDNARYWRDAACPTEFNGVPLRDCRKFYWEAGIHLRRPAPAGKPHPKHIEYKSGRVECIGEAYAPYKRWMESAISM